jgi:Tfp pilus assembly protein PilF
MKRLLLTLNFILLTFTLSFSQGNLPPGTYTSVNKKAIKHLEEGRKCYETHKDAEAEKQLLKAIEEDKDFVEPHIALGYL